MAVADDILIQSVKKNSSRAAASGIPGNTFVCGRCLASGGHIHQFQTIVKLKVKLQRSDLRTTCGIKIYINLHLTLARACLGIANV